MCSKRVNVILLILFSLLLATGSITHADSLLPLQIGLWYEYQSHDSAVPPNEWISRLEFQDKSTIAGKEYFKGERLGYDYPTDLVEQYSRSDETALYDYDTALNLEVISLMIGPIGTTWTYPHKTGSGRLGETVGTIINVLPELTVPYGTFTDVYVIEKYFDPTDPGPDSPHRFLYLVPGVGVIQEVDYWADNPPLVHNLVSTGLVPLPPSLVLLGSGLLGLLALRRRFHL